MKGNTLRPVITSACALIAALLVFGACRTKKETEELEKLPRVKEELLLQKLDSLSRQRPSHFTTKIASKYKDSEMKVSFKTSIRMTSDSALNALITYARIPIYNSMVTPDTLKIVDRRNNCFMIETMAYLKNTFSIDFEHRNIEEVLLGIPVAWDDDEKYHQINDPYHYIVSSHNKRSLRKAEKNLTRDEVFIRYYLSKELDAVKRIIIDSPADTTSITVNYYTREWVDGYYIPVDSDITVYTSRDTIYIDLKYSKSQANSPGDLHLVIPDNYKRCE